jgi:U6 snRNA-associated Sm-like protein LSm5
MSTLLPLEVIDKCVGAKITVLMSSEKEFSGKLVGFDDFVNIVLEDVEEKDTSTQKVTHRNKILLSGNHITMLIPGDSSA